MLLRKFERDPQMKEQFIALIDSLGGDQCTNWSQVSNFLNNSYNFNLDKAMGWKQIYLTLKYGKWNGFTEVEKGELIKAAVLSRGNNKLGFSNFLKNTEKKIGINRYTNGTQAILQQAIKQFVVMLSRKKTSNLRGGRLGYGRTIILFIKACDFEKGEDSTINELIQSAKCLEQLLLCYANNINTKRPKLFWELHQICSRSQFEQIIFHLTYVHQLKLIYTSKFYEDFTTHPLCLPQPTDNLKTEVFYRIIKCRDWDEKLQLFNSSTTDNQDYNLPLAEQKMKVNNTVYVSGPKPRQIQTVRGRIKLANRYHFKNFNTVIFNHEQEQKEEAVPVTFLEQRNQKLQELLEEAFRFDSLIDKQL